MHIVCRKHQILAMYSRSLTAKAPGGNANGVGTLIVRRHEHGHALRPRRSRDFIPRAGITE